MNKIYKKMTADDIENIKDISVVNKELKDIIAKYDSKKAPDIIIVFVGLLNDDIFLMDCYNNIFDLAVRSEYKSEYPEKERLIYFNKLCEIIKNL